MYNLLIVDDEKFVCEGLRKYVNWNELGYIVVETVESANEVFKIIETERIDVVLTDIIMPDMNGLELIGKLKELYPGMKTVILSGYGEFEYAKEAIRLGAYDFLLKPVDFSELKKIFSKMKELLDAEENEKKFHQEYMNFSREQFLNNLVKGFTSDLQVIRRKLLELNLPLHSNSITVLRLYVQNRGINNEYRYEDENLADVKRKLAEILKKHIDCISDSCVFDNAIKEISAILVTSQDESLNTQITKAQDEMKNKLGFTTHIGVGKTYNDIAMVSHSYNEAGKALEYKIIKRGSSILYYDDIVQFFKGQPFITEEVRTAILLYLTQADQDSLAAYVNGILNEICGIEKVNINLLYNTCFEIFLIINKYITNVAEDNKSNMDSEQNVIKTLVEKENIEDIKDFMNKYIINCIEIVKSRREDTAGSIAENAKKYINKHYSEEITLNKLSEMLYVHPIYLSKLFKEKTGENYIDYLTRVRIEKSKKLLADLSLKIYTITEMVGYDSPKYFSKTFKEIVGLTPKEYRDTLV